MSKDFSAALREKKLKNTPARETILNVFSTDCKPINAEQIFNKLKSKLKSKRVNLVTVYRTLASLEKTGIVRRIDMHKGAAYYELALEDHHHHLVCTDCGKVEKFEACEVEHATRNIVKNSNFKSISTHSLELFGICKKCAK